MAVNRTPVLKRCRSLEMDPVYLGIDKKSRRKAKNAGRKSRWKKSMSGNNLRKS